MNNNGIVVDSKNLPVIFDKISKIISRKETMMTYDVCSSKLKQVNQSTHILPGEDFILSKKQNKKKVVISTRVVKSCSTIQATIRKPENGDKHISVRSSNGIGEIIYQGEKVHITNNKVFILKQKPGTGKKYIEVWHFI